MPRVLRIGNHSVYVYNERRGQHHLAHAHIKDRDRNVGSIFLLTLEPFNCSAALPKDLLAAIADEQEAMLDMWAELNEG